MACEYICDGCGKREPADFNGREWVKPSSWYQRSDEDGIQDACCRECIEIISNGELTVKHVGLKEKAEEIK